MPSPVSPIQLSNIWHQRVIWIGIGQQATNTQQHLTNGQRGTPLILEDIKTDAAVRIDVTVINPRSEVNLGRFERVVCGKVDVQEEDTPGVWGVIRAHDCGLPVKHIISDWACGAICWWIFTKVHELYFV